MTRFTEMEQAMVRHAELPAEIAAHTGFARVAAFGKALVAHAKHGHVYRQVLKDLASLDRRMLADIGITQGDFHRVAAGSAQDRAPIARSLTGEIMSFLYDMTVGALVRRYRRHQAYSNLMALDDRLLRDIGVAREEIPALVKSLSGEAPAWAQPSSIFDRLTAWSRRRATVKSLSRLDDHMLADIGFVRSDINWVAEELAIRSMRPVANANMNSAPRAA